MLHGILNYSHASHPALPLAVCLVVRLTPQKLLLLTLVSHRQLGFIFLDLPLVLSSCSFIPLRGVNECIEMLETGAEWQRLLGLLLCVLFYPVSSFFL